MPAEHTLPDGLRETLDGYEVDRAFDRDCPTCEQPYSTGDHLVVTTERDPDSPSWTDISVVCSDCDASSLDPADRRSAVEQALVGVDVVSTPVAFVLDGDSAELLDYDPPEADR